MVGHRRNQFGLSQNYSLTLKHSANTPEQSKDQIFLHKTATSLPFRTNYSGFASDTSGDTDARNAYLIEQH